MGKVAGHELLLAEPGQRVFGWALRQRGREPGGGALQALVARAAADIAVDGRNRALLGSRRVAQTVARERHHEAHRAEAALRAALVHDGLLHGRELRAGRVDAFHRHDVLAVGVAQRREAAGHALVVHGLAVGRQLAYQHGAGPAVALAAADFGAFQLLVVAHEIEQGAGRGLAGADGLVVEEKFGHRGESIRTSC